MTRQKESNRVSGGGMMKATKAAQNAPKTQMKDISKKPELGRISGTLKDAKKNIQQQITKKVQNRYSMSERNRDRQAIENAFKKRVKNK